MRDGERAPAMSLARRSIASATARVSTTYSPCSIARASASLLMVLIIEKRTSILPVRVGIDLTASRSERQTE